MSDPTLVDVQAEVVRLRARLARYEDPDGSNVWDVAQHWMRVAVDDLAVIAYWRRNAERYQALWRARHDQAQALRAELAVTDDLLAERQRVLDACPPCPAHGACIPHALDWIADMRALHDV